jgi:hypothetical protein
MPRSLRDQLLRSTRSVVGRGFLDLLSSRRIEASFERVQEISYIAAVRCLKGWPAELLSIDSGRVAAVGGHKEAGSYQGDV